MPPTTEHETEADLLSPATTSNSALHYFFWIMNEIGYECLHFNFMYYVRTRQSFGHKVINKFQRFAYLQTQNQHIQLHNVSLSCGIQQNSETCIHEFPRNSIIQTSSAKIQIGENSDRPRRRLLPILKRGVVLTIRIASASPYTARYSLLVHQF